MRRLESIGDHAGLLALKKQYKMESPFTEEVIKTMHLIRQFENTSIECHWPYSILGRPVAVEIGYRFTVHATGGGGWYTVVKHEYQKRDGKWLLTGGTVVCNDSLKKCLFDLRVF